MTLSPLLQLGAQAQDFLRELGSCFEASPKLLRGVSLCHARLPEAHATNAASKGRYRFFSSVSPRKGHGVPLCCFTASILDSSVHGSPEGSADRT